MFTYFRRGRNSIEFICADLRPSVVNFLHVVEAIGRHSSGRLIGIALTQVGQEAKGRGIDRTHELRFYSANLLYCIAYRNPKFLPFLALKLRKFG